MSNFLAAAALVGLAGGVHCASMCGGVVTALSMADGARIIPLHPVPASTGARLGRLLAYNLGRITTYVLLGAVVGTLGSAAMLLQQVAPIERLLFAAAHVFMIAIGLFLMGMLPALSKIESAGYFIWRRIQPFMTRVLPATNLPRATGLGLLWGFVPCGMVYTMLLTALLSGSTGNGALVMLVFGLGTLPNLIGLGLLASAGKRMLQVRAWRRVAGAVVIVLGLIGVWHATLPVGGLLDTLCTTMGISR